MSSQVTLDAILTPGYIGTKPMKEMERRKEGHTHISLFTGIGGFDLGFHAAGFESRVMIECAKECCETLRANWFWSELQKRQNGKMVDNKFVPTGPLWKTKEEMKKSITWYQDREPVIIEKDIRTISTEEILKAADLSVGECSVISGGPPCQGFSTANIRRCTDDPRNFAFKEFVRIVREALPKTFILENVPGMVSSTKGKVIREICKEFADCGYEVTWNILNAVNYGVPQNRQRVIMLGKRVDTLFFPEIGNPRLHMGCQPGKIIHPSWFIKRYKLTLTEQETVHYEPRQGNWKPSKSKGDEIYGKERQENDAIDTEHRNGGYQLD